MAVNLVFGPDTLIISTNTTTVAAQPQLNLVAGNNITVTGSNNSSNNRVDVTITGGAGGVTFGPTYATPSVATLPSTQLNWNGASTNTVSGAVNFITTNTAGAFNIEGLYKSVPATPYSATIQIKANFNDQFVNGNNAFAECGLFWYDGTKLVTYGINCGNSEMRFITRQMNTVTSISANQTVGPTTWITLESVYLKIVDDGTNRKTYFSFDGVNFRLFDTELNNNFLTATNIGVYIQNAGMLILNYSQGTS